MSMEQYLEVFLDESREHLQVLSEQMLFLEQNPEELKVVDEIFRAAHTLKGMSATMGYDDIAHLTHTMENIFDGIRNEKIVLKKELFDIIFQAIEQLEVMVASIENGGDGKLDITELSQQLTALEKGEQVLTAENTQETNDSNFQYDQYEQTVIQQSLDQGFSCVEVDISLAPDCILKAARVFMVFEVLEKSGEVIKAFPEVEKLEEEQFDTAFKVTLITQNSHDELKKKIGKISEIDHVEVRDVHIQQQKDETDDKTPKQKDKPKQDKPATIKSNNKTIRVNIERLDVLMNLFEELTIDRARLEQIAHDIQNPELEETVERMTRVSSGLQNIILNMRMVPVDHVFNRFQRMVRQLARELGKELELNIIGAETELDRTVIDEIGDPIVHLLRNAIDHGIETPDVRVASGKPSTGTIELKAYHSGNHVFIEIEDNGRGINKQKVIEKAIKNSVITESEAERMKDQEIYELIMSSGFSTADTVSDVSGRGVGLDVVRTTIESLGGLITIDSIEGKGSKFSIQLPLTLSIISAMLIEVGKEKYAIPLSSIIETAIIRKDEVLLAHNQKVIDFRGKIIPVIPLADTFQVDRNGEIDDEFISLIIVRKGEKMAALVVDSFIGQQEIVLKSLGKYLDEVFAISGATILGDGQVALIIDCNALIK